MTGSGKCRSRCECGAWCTGEDDHVTDPRKLSVHVCENGHVF